MQSMLPSLRLRAKICWKQSKNYFHYWIATSSFGLLAMTLLFSLLLIPNNSSARLKRDQPQRKKNNDQTTESSQNNTAQPRSEAGLKILNWNLAIDASFDPELDDIVPGYHIVNIVVTNNRDTPIELDVRNDKWTIIDKAGTRRRAINHVSFISKKVWESFPEKLKQKLDYPQWIRPGRLANIDVFLPKAIDLNSFREIRWNSSSFNREFSIYTNVEDNISVQETDQKDILINDIQKSYSPEDEAKSRDEILNPQSEDSTEQVGDSTLSDPAIEDTLQKAENIKPGSEESLVQQIQNAQIEKLKEELKRLAPDNSSKNTYKQNEDPKNPDDQGADINLDDAIPMN